MAVVSYTSESVDGNVRVVTWATMANGDTGQPYTVAQYGDAGVHAYGTFGTGGNCRIQGSNESGTPAQWATLTNPQGDALNLTTSPSLEQVLQRVYQLRPNITAGDGTTSVTVKMMLGNAPQRWRTQD